MDNRKNFTQKMLLRDAVEAPALKPEDSDKVVADSI